MSAPTASERGRLPGDRDRVASLRVAPAAYGAVAVDTRGAVVCREIARFAGGPPPRPQPPVAPSGAVPLAAGRAPAAAEVVQRAAAHW
jgi:hypothetical protein